MSSQRHSQGTAASPTKLSAGTVWRYATGSLGTGGFGTLPGLVLLFYMTDTLGVAALAAGIVVAIPKAWDVVISPVIGGLSDHGLATTGTRRKLMLIGSVSLPFAFALTFAVPAGLEPWIGAVWVLLAFLAATTFFNLFQVPYLALPTELTHSYHERTRLLTTRIVVLTFSILLFGAGAPMIRARFSDNPNLGYLVMAIFAAVLIGVSLVVSSFVAPRGKPTGRSGTQSRALAASHYKEALATLRESQPFRALITTFTLQSIAIGMMLAGAQYVAKWVLHNENAVTPLFAALIAPALIAAPLWRLVAKRIGKERAYRVASWVFIAATILLLGMIWAPGWWILGPVALTGAAYAGVQALPLAMLPDVIGHDSTQAITIINEETGGAESNRGGAFTGVWSSFEMTASAVASIVLTLALGLSGYVESTGTQTVEQPASAVLGVSLSFSLIPAVLMIVSLFSLSRYRLREADITA
ncbi:MFS transporter [Microbacterium sp.]|uniref:MFS transporter n=1 Tax=Microbacterium sp. TaxID=51671 RepID=UPI0039E664FF